MLSHSRSQLLRRRWLGSGNADDMPAVEVSFVSKVFLCFCERYFCGPRCALSRAGPGAEWDCRWPSTMASGTTSTSNIPFVSQRGDRPADGGLRKSINGKPIYRTISLLGTGGLGPFLEKFRRHTKRFGTAQNLLARESDGMPMTFGSRMDIVRTKEEWFTFADSGIQVAATAGPVR